MSTESILIATFMAAMAVWILWDLRRRKVRRDSLRYDREIGVYIWIDFDGRERRDTKDPRNDDGAWSDGDGGDGGDGGGGD